MLDIIVIVSFYGPEVIGTVKELLHPFIMINILHGHDTPGIQIFKRDTVSIRFFPSIQARDFRIPAYPASACHRTGKVFSILLHHGLNKPFKLFLIGKNLEHSQNLKGTDKEFCLEYI